MCLVATVIQNGFTFITDGVKWRVATVIQNMFTFINAFFLVFALKDPFFFFFSLSLSLSLSPLIQDNTNTM